MHVSYLVPLHLVMTASFTLTLLSSGFKFSQLEMSTSWLFVDVRSQLTRLHLVSEVVLAILLSSFTFELTDQEITWNSSAVMYPTMGEESTKAEMLLKVRAL